MNLFRNRSTEPLVIHRQRIVTRLYLICLTACFILIILYTILPTEPVMRTVQSPSLSTYQALKVKYSTNLDCPCTRISVLYEEFMTIAVNSHHICSSEFIKASWIYGLYRNSYWLFYKRADIRIRGAAYFNLLAILCQLARTNIDRAIDEFLQGSFHSFQVVSESEFRFQMDSIVKEFEVTTKRRFGHALELYRNMTHGNSFISSYFLNWYIWVPPTRTYGTLPTSPIIIDNQCSCGTQSDCTEQAGVYDINTGQLLDVIPGLNIGCSVVETVLRSNLRCLYDQQCINMIQYYLRMNSTAFQALNASLLSWFSINTTIQDIVNDLFVEQWYFNVSYSPFYQQCAPKYCTYFEGKRKQISFILARLLGFYGGLTVTLRFLVPYIIALWFKLKNYYYRNRVTIFA